MFNVTAAMLQQCRQQLFLAALRQDWQVLSQTDLKLRRLLTACRQQYRQSGLNPEIQTELARLQLEHQRAMQALSEAREEVQIQIAATGDQKERFEAYQLALNME